MTADRPDALKGYQVHIVYALPSDGADRALDTNGTLATSVLAWQKWLRGQMGTATLRVDSYRPTANASLQPDITFARLSQTDAQMASTGGNSVVLNIEQELRSSGLINANDSARKIYAVYYDGSSTFSCGGSAWPPTLVGKVAALYLKGTPPGAPACTTIAFAPNPRSPGYLEFAMLHDILHALGFVPTCAPGQWRTGHVPEPNDLMYGGDVPWQRPPVLDVGHNDYYKANIPGCPELSRSAYLKPTPARGTTPGWMIPFRTQPTLNRDTAARPKRKNAFASIFVSMPPTPRLHGSSASATLQRRFEPTSVEGPWIPRRAFPTRRRGFGGPA